MTPLACMLQVYNRELNATEMTAVEDYLSELFDLPLERPICACGAAGRGSSHPPPVVTAAISTID